MKIDASVTLVALHVVLIVTAKIVTILVVKNQLHENEVYSLITYTHYAQ